MDIHKNALLTPKGRLALVKRALQPGVSRRRAAAEFGTTAKTVSKWFTRYQQYGVDGLSDRKSRPLTRHPRAINRQQRNRIKRRWTIDRIADRLRVSPATVARHLKRMGLNRLASLEPAPVIQRYERKQTVVAFFARARDYFATLGIKVEGLMTYNGPAYRSVLFKRQLEAAGIKHTLTRPYTPRTNGKAERFIQTLLREWAYAHSYRTSHQRRKALKPWLHDYNWHRPHGSLNKRPPITRLALSEDNLVTYHR